MNQFIETDSFADWFGGLRDAQAKARINARLRRAELGSFGDCEPVGEGVSEMRIHYGPGYRVYWSNEDTRYSFCWRVAINLPNQKILKPRCNWHEN